MLVKRFKKQALILGGVAIAGIIGTLVAINYKKVTDEPDDNDENQSEEVNFDDLNANVIKEDNVSPIDDSDIEL